MCSLFETAQFYYLKKNAFNQDASITNIITLNIALLLFFSFYGTFKTILLYKSSYAREAYPQTCMKL